MEKLSLKKRYSRLSVARKIKQQVAIPAWRVLLISSGCRVIIAAMPPPNAYTAHITAKTSAKEPNTSTATPPLPGRPGYPTSRFAWWNWLRRHRFPLALLHIWKRISPAPLRPRIVLLDRGGPPRGPGIYLQKCPAEGRCQCS